MPETTTLPETRSQLKAERIQGLSERLKAERIQERLKAERIQNRLEELPGWRTVQGESALKRCHPLGGVASSVRQLATGTSEYRLGKLQVARGYNHVVIGTTPYTVELAETYLYGGKQGRVSSRATQTYVKAKDSAEMRPPRPTLLRQAA